MSKRNQLTSLQREVLSPLVGKIATGFRYEASPRHDLFSDKFTVRLRSLDDHESELFLGLHYKYYLPEPAEPGLNIGINLLHTAEIEYQPVLQGFSPEHEGTLQVFLRQPITGFHLTPTQTLVLIFAHQSLIFELDREKNGQLFLGWAILGNGRRPSL